MSAVARFDTPLVAPLAERAVAALFALYLLAQAFTLPLLAIGPSWTVWQALPDLLVWMMGGLALTFRAPFASPELTRLWRLLLGLAVLGLLALGVLFVYADPRRDQALLFGVYQLYRLAQVVLVFWTASRLRFTPAREVWWYRAALAAFVLTVAGVAITYVTPRAVELLGTVLPRGTGVAGPWEGYYRTGGPGLGFIGYNHGYSALQVTVLAAIVLTLGRRIGRDHTPIVVLAAIVAAFLTGSRAGLLGALVFAALSMRRFPIRAILAVFGASLALLLLWPTLAPALGGILDRQTTLLDAADADNLSGRTDIWQNYLGTLLADPFRLVLGSGFGSAIYNDGNAHMLFLQVLFETGLVGLTALVGFFGALLVGLRRLGARGEVAFNVTLAFLVTCLTQETFYPNAAFGGFLALYAALVALSFARSARPEGRAA